MSGGATKDWDKREGRLGLVMNRLDRTCAFVLFLVLWKSMSRIIDIASFDGGAGEGTATLPTLLSIDPIATSVAAGKSDALSLPLFIRGPKNRDIGGIPPGGGASEATATFPTLASTDPVATSIIAGTSSAFPFPFSNVVNCENGGTSFNGGVGEATTFPTPTSADPVVTPIIVGISIAFPFPFSSAVNCDVEISSDGDAGGAAATLATMVLADSAVMSGTTDIPDAIPLPFTDPVCGGIGILTDAHADAATAPSSTTDSAATSGKAVLSGMFAFSFSDVMDCGGDGVPFNGNGGGAAAMFPTMVSADPVTTSTTADMSDGCSLAGGSDRRSALADSHSSCTTIAQTFGSEPCASSSLSAVEISGYEQIEVGFGAGSMISSK